ncbi:MAG TPA: NAD(P)H-hydrate epimerase [Nitrospiraceae bacterium]|nr:NAD(P)H-hydrate epimerase [Nitrospiraceae bacterium]
MPQQFLSRDQVRRIDQRALDEYGLAGIVLMENAGRGCVEVLCEVGISGPVLICCGKGNNAGDGFVIARHLDGRGFTPKVLLWCDPYQLRGDAAINYEILSKTDVPIVACAGRAAGEWLEDELAGADWIVDALLGTGTVGAPRAPFDSVIEALNRHRCKKLSVDLPSGLDCDMGQPAQPTFRAAHTCTFVAAKIGFQSPQAKDCLGIVHVVDIGVPGRLLHEMQT